MDNFLIKFTFSMIFILMFIVMIASKNESKNISHQKDNVTITTNGDTVTYTYSTK